MTPWHHVTPALIAAIRAQYRLHWSGIHGEAHWRRVHTNGLRLAEATGADAKIVEFFAALHDACRWSHGYDVEHGARAAEWLLTLDRKLVPLDDVQRAVLAEACRTHTTGTHTDDITVATCWDADRLDLMRVGTTPDPRRLATEAARDPKVLDWAMKRSLGRASV